MILRLHALETRPGATTPPLVFHLGTHRIGAGPENDFVLVAPGIAEHHCIVRVDAAGIGIAAGAADATTRVNNRALSPTRELALLPDDRLQLGKLQLRVEIERRPTDASRTANDRTPSPQLRPAAAPAVIEPGGEFAGYRIEETLGTGGCAVVYRARPASGSTDAVALKVLHANTPFAFDAAQRLYREGRLAGALAEHPGIVRVLELGRAAGRTFAVTEYVAGEDLQRRIDRQGPLRADLAVGIARDLADCLAFARRQGVIHRDVKPANVLLAQAGGVRLLDLGLARRPLGPQDSCVTVTVCGVGTPEYIAPEQALDAVGADHRADIYGLGATLFCMVCGRPPLRIGKPLEFLEQLLKAEPPSLAEIVPGTPEPLCRLVARCLRKDPAERYPDYPELMRELSALPSTPYEGRA